MSLHLLAMALLVLMIGLIDHHRGAAARREFAIGAGLLVLAFAVAGVEGFVRGRAKKGPPPERQ